MYMTRNLAGILPKIRKLRKSPVKLILVLFAIYLTVRGVLSLAEVLLLKKLRTNPRYMDVHEDLRSLQVVDVILNDPPVDKAPEKWTEEEEHLQRHLVLCVDSYLTPLHADTLYFPICIHDSMNDRYISGSLSSGSLYEHDYVQVFLSYFTPGSDEGLLDLGANLGVYSLPAAHLGHKVVAVDALPENVIRLKASAKLGHVEEKVSVFHAAVSNIHGKLYAQRTSQNLGGTSVVNKSDCGYYCDNQKAIPAVFMDDLIQNITFRKGLLKVDIEGHEVLAFERSSKLLEAIDFHTILMEWKSFYRYFQVYNHHERINNFIRFLTDQYYTPCDVFSGRPLHVYEWGHWPPEVLWRKSHNLKEE